MAERKARKKKHVNTRKKIQIFLLSAVQEKNLEIQSICRRRLAPRATLESSSHLCSILVDLPDRRALVWAFSLTNVLSCAAVVFQVFTIMTFIHDHHTAHLIVISQCRSCVTNIASGIDKLMSTEFTYYLNSHIQIHLPQ